MDWYMMVWQKFAEFNGRARRKEYWMFQLINGLIGVAAALVGTLLMTSTKLTLPPQNGALSLLL